SYFHDNDLVKIKTLYITGARAKSFVEHHDIPVKYNLPFPKRNDLQFVKPLAQLLVRRNLNALDGSMRLNAGLIHAYIPYVALTLSGHHRTNLEHLLHRQFLLLYSTLETFRIYFLSLQVHVSK